MVTIICIQLAHSLPTLLLRIIVPSRTLRKLPYRLIHSLNKWHAIIISDLSTTKKIHIHMLMVTIFWILSRFFVLLDDKLPKNGKPNVKPPPDSWYLSKPKPWRRGCTPRMGSRMGAGHRGGRRPVRPCPLPRHMPKHSCHHPTEILRKSSSYKSLADKLWEERERIKLTSVRLLWIAYFRMYYDYVTATHNIIFDIEMHCY